MSRVILGQSNSEGVCEMKLSRMLLVFGLSIVILTIVSMLAFAEERVVLKWEAKDEIVDEEVVLSDGRVMPIYVIKGDGLDAVARTGESDGAFQVVQSFGTVAITTANKSEWQYIYFRVADLAFSNLEKGYSARLKVNYLDSVPSGQYGMHYDSWNPEGTADGAFTFIGFRYTEGGNRIRTAVFDLEDVRFARRQQWCADFRICFYATPSFLMRIVSVELEIWKSESDALVWH